MDVNKKNHSRGKNRNKPSYDKNMDKGSVKDKLFKNLQQIKENAPEKKEPNRNREAAR